jgi:hypothetical protein
LQIKLILEWYLSITDMDTNWFTLWRNQRVLVIGRELSEVELMNL